MHNLLVYLLRLPSQLFIALSQPEQRFGADIAGSRRVRGDLLVDIHGRLQIAVDVFLFYAGFQSHTGRNWCGLGVSRLRQHQGTEGQQEIKDAGNHCSARANLAIAEVEPAVSIRVEFGGESCMGRLKIRYTQRINQSCFRSIRTSSVLGNVPVMIC